LFTLAKDALRANPGASNRGLERRYEYTKIALELPTKIYRETNIKQKMLRIQLPLAFSNGVFLENLIFYISFSTTLFMLLFDKTYPKQRATVSVGSVLK
jgi:hypothetical protein